jgi:cell division protein DivIC
MWIVAAVAVVLCASMLIGQYKLQKTSNALAAEQTQLEQGVEDAKAKRKALDNQEAYMQTDEYVEDVARDKLGMVKDNEILFKAQDKQ